MRSPGSVEEPQYDEMEIKEQLDLMGVSVVEPETNKEFLQAEAFEAFSTFVLEDNKDECLAILEEPNDETVGALAGGSEEYSIYRASIITGKEDDSSAVSRLLQLFHAAQPRYANVLTVPKLERYMLAMCENNKRHTKCRGLGNLMLIFAFGPTNGQVRHIDHMDPNLMVCCFMSKACPTTIVYQMDEEGGPIITNAGQLVEYWQQQGEVVPQLVQDILVEQGDTPLNDSVATKYFKFWNTINSTLRNFGTLYFKVATPLALKGVDPGTTMIAGPVNQVHAGPPTTGPRMFAFAIGIPETNDVVHAAEEENNGEIQYSAVLLHVDLCCILFGIMEYDYTHRLDEYDAAKQFLLQILVTLCEDLPLDYFDRQLGDDRARVRDWLGKTVQRLTGNSKEQLNDLLQDAMEDETMFYSPHVVKLRSKKKRRAKTRKR